MIIKINKTSSEQYPFEVVEYYENANEAKQVHSASDIDAMLNAPGFDKGDPNAPMFRRLVSEHATEEEARSAAEKAAASNWSGLAVRVA